MMALMITNRTCIYKNTALINWLNSILILIHSCFSPLNTQRALHTARTVVRSGHRCQSVFRERARSNWTKAIWWQMRLASGGPGTMCCYCCSVCVQYVCAYSVLCWCICACMHIRVCACTATVYVLVCLCIHVCVWGGRWWWWWGPQGPALCLSHLPPHSADTQGTGRKDGEFILAKRNRGPVA